MSDEALGATNDFCAKAKRQRQMFTVRKQQDVGHEGVITGRDGFSLRSFIADPREVAQSPLQGFFKNFLKCGVTLGEEDFHSF